MLVLLALGIDMGDLTTNFSKIEFERSQTASSKGIDNAVPRYYKAELQHLADWCQSLRDKLTAQFGPSTKVRVSSGYRCLELNTAIGGSGSSDHMKCAAVDISADGLSTEELFQFIRKNMDYIKVIQEFDRWVHVTVPHPEHTSVDLRAIKREGNTVYESI